MNKSLVGMAGIIVIFSLVGIVFYAGYAYREKEFTEYFAQFKPLRKGFSEFTLINPLVGIDSPNVFGINLFSETKRSLQDLLETSKEKGLLEAGVYYRDLNTSVWFGLYEEEKFVPASLLKMTYALAVYKKGESDTTFLEKRFVYTDEIASETKKRNNAETSTQLEMGRAYSVRELLKIMLEKSDNGARDMLSQITDEKYLHEVFTYLGILEPSAINNFEMSTADYALFFRMLYSSTFINEKHSEELLSILTSTDFPFGIVQPLPSKILIAHKWGVFNFPVDEKGVVLHELHDCGIVYEPDKPYLLCVMTKGTNQEILLEFIAESSKIIYEDTVIKQR